jgi:hypothetical protein
MEVHDWKYLVAEPVASENSYISLREWVYSSWVNSAISVYRRLSSRPYSNNSCWNVLIAWSLYSQVEVHSWTYIRGIRSMSCMSCSHACALSWHLQLSLASPAQYGMTIILERLCISPTEAIRQGDNPYLQHSPLLLCSMEQENKQTNKQTNCNSHSSLFKTLRGKWAGKEYYRSLRMAIHIKKEIHIPKSKTTLSPTLNRPPITINPLLSWTCNADH